MDNNWCRRQEILPEGETTLLQLEQFLELANFPQNKFGRKRIAVQHYVNSSNMITLDKCQTHLRNMADETRSFSFLIFTKGPRPAYHQAKGLLVTRSRDYISQMETMNYYLEPH